MLRFQLNTTGNLMKDLIAFWPLDEPGGQRRDMLGYNPLTDNATVTSASGIGGQGTAAKFTSANSEYLNIADNPQLSVGDVALTISAWVYLDSTAGTQNVLGKWGGGTPDVEYNIRKEDPTSTNKFTFQVRNTADTTTTTVDTIVPTTGRWYFLIAQHDPTNDIITLSTDNGVFSSVSTTGGIKDGGIAFRMGASSAATPTGFLDGRLAYVGFWKRVLSQQERSDLYNSGRGNRLIAY